MLINNGYMVYSNINQLKQIYWRQSEYVGKGGDYSVNYVAG